MKFLKIFLFTLLILFSYHISSVRANSTTDSVVITTTTNTAPSNPPTGITISSGSTCGIGQNIISWNPVDGASTYQVYRNGSKIFGGLVTTFTDTGLSLATSYSYTVTAINSYGSSAASSPVIGVTMNNCLPVPSLKITSWVGTNMASPVETYTGDSYTLSWITVPYASSCTLDGSAVSVTGSQGGYLATLPTKTHTLSCLNSTGQTTSTTATVTTLPVPTNLTYSCNAAATYATLSWTAPSGYNTFYTRASRNSDGVTVLYNDISTGTTDSFSITPNTAYKAWVHTRNPYTGAWSTQANVDINCIQYLVSTSAGTGGSISPTSSNVSTGSTTAFTVTPNAGYLINTVSGCSGSLSGSTYTTGIINAACTVTATFKQMTGTITPATSSCLIAVGNSICNVNMSWSTTNPIGTSAITASSMTDVNGNSGTTVSFVVPYSSRIFYLYNNSIKLATTTITSSCSANSTWNGSICALDTHLVTTSVGTGGSIEASKNVSHGSTTTIAITPTVGYSISSVAGTCGGTLSGNTYTTSAINAACTVTSTFTLNTNKLTITSLGGISGTYAAAGVYNVNYGSSPVVTAAAWAGYSVAISGGCTASGGVAVSATCTVSNMTSAQTVTVTYTISTNLVTASAGVGGTISPASKNVNYGSTTAFTVTPNAGYLIDTVGGTCGGTLSGNTYTTNAINAACTVTATFDTPHLKVTTSYGSFTDTSTETNIYDPYTLSWAALPADAKSCTLDLVSVSTSGGTKTGYSASLLTQSHILTCLSATTNNPSTSKVTVTIPPPPTNFTYTCNAASNAATVSWTAPSGYTDFYLGVYLSTQTWADHYNASTTPSIPYPMNGVTKTFAVNPNTNYTAYVETESANGAWGTSPSNLTINCIKNYNVTASAGSNGTISPATSVVAPGSTATFALSPSTYYDVNTVTGTCGGTLSGNTYTTNAINADCTVIASFKLKNTTGNISSVNCSIPTNQNSCSASLSWNTIDSIGYTSTVDYLFTKPDGTTIAKTLATANSSAGTPYLMTFGNQVFDLNNNGKKLASVTSSAQCVLGDVLWSSGLCKPGSVSSDVNLSADSTSVRKGKKATIRWDSTNMVSCSGTKFTTGPLPNTNGVYISAPLDKSITYTISCTDTSGNVKSASVPIIVDTTSSLLEV